MIGRLLVTGALLCGVAARAHKQNDNEKEAPADECWDQIKFDDLGGFKDAESFCKNLDLLKKLAKVPDRCDLPKKLPAVLDLDKLQRIRLTARCVAASPTKICGEDLWSEYQGNLGHIAENQNTKPKAWAVKKDKKPLSYFDFANQVGSLPAATEDHQFLSQIRILRSAFQNRSLKDNEFWERVKLSSGTFPEFSGLPGPLENSEVLFNSYFNRVNPNFANLDIADSLDRSKGAGHVFREYLWAAHLHFVCPANPPPSKKNLGHLDQDGFDIVEEFLAKVTSPYFTKKRINEEELAPTKVKKLVESINQIAWKGDCWPYRWQDVDPAQKKSKKYVFLISGFSSFYPDPDQKLWELYGYRNDFRDEKGRSLLYVPQELLEYNTLFLRPIDYDALGVSILNKSEPGSLEILHFPHDQLGRMFRCAQKILGEVYIQDGKKYRSSLALVGHSNGGHAAAQVARMLAKEKLPLDGLVVLDGVPKIANQIFPSGDEFDVPANVPPDAVLNVLQTSGDTFAKRLIMGRELTGPNKNQFLQLETTTNGLPNPYGEKTDHEGVPYEARNIVAHHLLTTVPFRVPVK